MYHKILSDGIFVFSCFALFIAIIGWTIGDIWLASTQWMLVAIVLLLIAVYVKLSAKEDAEILKGYKRKK